MIIVLSSLGVTAVGVIIALIAVIAAFTANTTGNFSVTYTAKNVKATVVAQYWYHGVDPNSPLIGTTSPSMEEIFGEGHGVTLQTTNNLNSMVFDGSEESETVTKAFKDVEIKMSEYPRNQQLNPNKLPVYVMYQITNDSETDNINLRCELNTISSTNASVNIYKCVAPSINYWEWQTYEDFSDVVIAPQETYTVYFEINISEGNSGSFDGSWNFLLSVAE